jgi:hypothetical protein
MKFSIAFLAISLPVVLQAVSALPLEIERREMAYTCAARVAVGRFGPYPRHQYTDNQAEAARLSAHTIQQKKGENWVPTEADYPHFFHNKEKLAFDCGKNKAEFPIKMDGSVFVDTEPVNAIPDRVIYEYTWTNRGLTTKICGIIRHGVGRDFDSCPPQARDLKAH